MVMLDINPAHVLVKLCALSLDNDMFLITCILYRIVYPSYGSVGNCMKVYVQCVGVNIQWKSMMSAGSTLFHWFGDNTLGPL